MTSVNGRLLPTFGLLLARPGALSLAYRQGRWRRYLAPINVFLLANLAFFLAPSLTDFNVTLEDQVTLQPYSAWIAPWVDARVAASGLAFEAFAERYAERGADIAKTLVILHVPLLALVTMLLFFDKRLLYADHVVTALHFFAFLMLYYTCLPFLIYPLFNLLGTLTGGAINGFTLSISIQFLYVPFMMRRAFGVGWPRALISTIVFLPLLLLVHLFYRFVQLFVVIALL